MKRSGKAVGIIPARWSSTRFPGKPLHLIGDKPLLWHVWNQCRRANKLDALIIATDDMRIANAAFDWGAEVAITSKKHQSGTDRIAEVVSHASRYDVIINIQGDEPLIEPALLNRLVQTLRSNPKMDIVTAAHPFKNAADAASPHQVKVIVDRNNDAIYFSRYPIPFPRNRSVAIKYLRHQGVYGFRRKALLDLVGLKPTPLERAESLEQLRALENGVKVHVLLTNHGSPGVDTPADAKALEQKLARARRRGVGGSQLYGGRRRAERARLGKPGASIGNRGSR